jgi:acyl-CoA thioester hydrolase
MDSHSEQRKEATAEFPVRYAETDAMGVVHHASYIVYFEEARSHYMRAQGSDYALVEADGSRLPVTEVQVRYVGSLVYGDRARVRAWIAENKSRRLTFNYEIRNAEDDRVLVTGSTQHIWTDLEGRVTRAPEKWKF